MNKYCGLIGYAYHEETRPGVFEEVNISRKRRGDIQDERRNLYYRDSVNGERTVTATISIVADKFDVAHFTDMVWAELYGKKWEVQQATPVHPRIVIHLGGLYKENLEEEEDTNGSE